MVDALIEFDEGDDILASQTNSNNQFLLSKITDSSEQLQSYLETQIASIQSNIASVQSTLQQNINTVKNDINSSLKGRNFTQKSQTIGIGTTKLSSYLPNDGYCYLVWVSAYQQGGGNGDQLTIKTDRMTTARRAFWLDGDAGRYSRGVFLGAVPVGTGRSITTAGNAANITLCGYCKM